MKTSERDVLHFRRETAAIDAIYKEEQFVMPVRYVLGVTSDCNLHCSFCFLKKPEVGCAMTLEDWRNLIEQIPSDSRIILFGGEPLFYEHFSEVYKCATSRCQCTVVTNGTLLSPEVIETLVGEERLQDIAVSVDMVGNANRGFTAKQWLQLVDSVRLFKRRASEVGRGAKLGISAVILDETADGLFELHKCAHEDLNCDYITYCLLNGTSLQLADTMTQSFDGLFQQEDAPLYKKWSVILEQLECIRKYDQEHNKQSYFRPKIVELSGNLPLENLNVLNKAQFKPDNYCPCTLPWSDCRIYSDGSVVSCLAYPFGNFKETPNLAQILRGQKAQQFRNHIRRGLFPQCNRCVFLYDRRYC